MDSVQERCQQRDVDWCCVDTQRVDAWALSTVNCQLSGARSHCDGRLMSTIIIPDDSFINPLFTVHCLDD